MDVKAADKKEQLSLKEAWARLGSTIRELVANIEERYRNLAKSILPDGQRKEWLNRKNKRRCRTHRVQTAQRTNTVPLGTATYLYKSHEMKNLARCDKTSATPKKGHKKIEQCKHTFRITSKRCAPCDGYNKECEEYSVAHDKMN